MLEPGPPGDIKAIPIDRYTVLVAWLPPRHQNGRIIHYTIYMKTMESNRGQYTRQFRVTPLASSASSDIYGHNQNFRTNAFFSIEGLSEVGVLSCLSCQIEV